MSQERGEKGSSFYFCISYPWRKYGNSYVFMNHKFSMHFNIMSIMEQYSEGLLGQSRWGKCWKGGALEVLYLNLFIWNLLFIFHSSRNFPSLRFWAVTWLENGKCHKGAKKEREVRRIKELEEVSFQCFVCIHVRQRYMFLRECLD